MAPDESAAEQRLRAAFEVFLERVETGDDPPDLLALCDGDPRLADELARLVESDLVIAAALEGRDAIDAELPYGAQVGEFRLLAPLGVGGMGRVYLAEQPSLDRLVALKIVAADGLAERGGPLRFRREAEIAASLEHPNIVPIYAVGEEDGLHFIAMKWLTGPGLDALEERLEPRRAAEVGAGIADALAEAHRSGIIHRDVKPANVILDHETPVVVDFGLSRSQGDPRLTVEGRIAGTLAYMAPERFASDGLDLDPRIDVYGLGATLYEALTGRPPFDVTDPARLVRAVVEAEPRPLDLPAAERDLETIVRRALAKEPERRFRTAAAMAADLRRYLSREPIESRRAGPGYRLAKLVRRRPRTVLALTVLTLIAVVSLSLQGYRIRREDQELRERCARGLQAVEARRLTEARLLTETLVRERPDEPEVRELAVAVESLAALEDLIDLIMDPPGDQSPRLLEEKVARLHRTGASALAPRDGRLALAFAAMYQGRTDAARRLLDEVEAAAGGVGLATAAVRAWAAGETAITLPAGGFRSPDELVFAALALRFVGAPEGAQEALLLEALRQDGGHYRAQYCLALIPLRSHDYRVAALALACLGRSDRRHPSRLVLQAWLSAIAGDLDVADETLSRLSVADETPRAQWVRADLLRRRGREREGWRVLRAAVDRWPSDALLSIAWARVVREPQDLDQARAFLETARSSTAHDQLRDIATAAVLRLDLLALTGMRPLVPIVDESVYARLADLDARAEQESLRVRTAAARAGIGLVRGWIAHQLGRTEAALAQFETAIAAEPRDPAPHVAFCQVVALARHGARFRAACEHALAVLDMDRRGLIQPTETDLAVCFLLAVSLLQDLGDHAASRAVAERGIQRLRDEALIEKLEDLIDALDR